MTTRKRVAIVTGAASGLGRAMTLGLLRSGFAVAAVDKDGPLLGELTTAEPGSADALLTIAADLAKTAAFETIVLATLEKFGCIDVLVNNAGIGLWAVRPDHIQNPIRCWEITRAQWETFVAVNATAPIMLARTVVPHMLSAGHGRIITVTTSLGTMVRKGQLLYGASKAAAEAAMAILAADLDGTGVTSNVLVPGGVTNTRLVGDYGVDRSKMLQPEIMVPPLLWLVSDAAAHVNARRFIAADWDTGLPPAEAAAKASAPIAWLDIARMPIEPL